MDASLGHEIEELGIEGIDTVLEPKRTYPQGHLAAQVLGMVGVENTGLSGIEYAHDEQLAGERRPPPAREGRARRAREPDRDRPRRGG